jgi:hypothetical protein
VVVVDGSVVGGSVVVVAGAVVVVVGAVVVVAVGCVVVVAAARVVGVEAGARVVGVVLGAGKRTEPGNVEIFDDFGLDGAFASGVFPGAVVELVVVDPAAGAAVVVVVVTAVGEGNFAETSPTVWPRTSSGRSSWCTTTKRPATATTTVVPQLHCSSRRWPEVTVPTL